ncbi:hypothetical protein [Bordetella genomosp. 11]|uniref:Uncharacterized protein n=1 Tax=Bordetella genomosp. 11 TaxID=1416808 RepID=A0A261UKH4_9BORD|nr:hypothetical protein [Bordetella genomosp. 11]OZI62141.1 hypothetical protein CAL28_23250 [Bordetella genomosp. 11]
MEHHDQPSALSADDLEVIAQATGALPRDGKMTSELLEYTRTIVGHCASIGDGSMRGDRSAGDAIRAAFGLG